MVILGIDPGFIIAGYAVLKSENGRISLLDYGFLKMSSRQSIQERLVIFQDHMDQKIEQFGVTHVALETPFLGKNAQNFLKLGYLRGALLLLVQRKKLIVHELSPREIKRALTGFGGADKEQLARVIARLFPRISFPLKLDVTDAIAVALCGLWASHKKRV